jgi:hypothetical protein
MNKLLGRDSNPQPYPLTWICSIQLSYQAALASNGVLTWE